VGKRGQGFGAEHCAGRTTDGTPAVNGAPFPAFKPRRKVIVTTIGTKFGPRDYSNLECACPDRLTGPRIITAYIAPPISLSRKQFYSSGGRDLPPPMAARPMALNIGLGQFAGRLKWVVALDADNPSLKQPHFRLVRDAGSTDPKRWGRGSRQCKVGANSIHNDDVNAAGGRRWNMEDIVAQNLERRGPSGRHWTRWKVVAGGRVGGAWREWRGRLARGLALGGLSCRHTWGNQIQGNHHCDFQTQGLPSFSSIPPGEIAWTGRLPPLGAGLGPSSAFGLGLWHAAMFVKSTAAYHL